MAFKFNFAEKYNTERVFDVDTSGYEYNSLQEIFDGDLGHVYPVLGIYINTKSLYEDAPVIATDECYVNLPSHLCDTCKEILADPAAIKAINDGLVGFTIYTYFQRRFNKECFSIRWVNIDPKDFDKSL